MRIPVLEPAYVPLRHAFRDPTFFGGPLHQAGQLLDRQIGFLSTLLKIVPPLHQYISPAR